MWLQETSLDKASSQQEPFIGVPQCQHKEHNRPDIDYSNENETATMRHDLNYPFSVIVG